MIPDLTDVEDVRVCVAFARRPAGAPVEVFLLALQRPAAAAAQPWDEAAYRAALDPVVQAHPDRPCALSVSRSATTWQLTAGRADVVLRLGLADVESTVAPGTRQAVLGAFGQILELERAGTFEPVVRDAAVASARRAAERVHDDAAALQLTDEEHRPADGSWQLGLMAGDGTQLRVTVGVLGGDPRTVYVRRRAAAEVVDSVGV